MSEYNGNYILNGAFGLALLNITSNEEVKISPFVATVSANPIFISSMFALLKSTVWVLLVKEISVFEA